MPDRLLSKKTLWNRRKVLTLGLAGIGVTGGAIALQQFAQKRYSPAIVKVPSIPKDAPAYGNGISPMAMVRDFDAKPYGVHLYHCHISPVSTLPPHFIFMPISFESIPQE